MFKHIIWDWNGTIFNDLDLCIDIMNNVLYNYNKPQISKSDYLDKFSFPVNNYYNSIGISSDEFESTSHEFIRNYEKRRMESSLHYGSIELLETLKTLGVTQYVLSAYKHDTLVGLISQFNLSKYFSKLLGQDNIYAHGKIEAGKKFVSELQVNPSEIVMIGDTFHDYEVACEIGIECILISHGHNSKRSLLRTNKPIVDNFDKLRKLLLK